MPLISKYSKINNLKVVLPNCYIFGAVADLDFKTFGDRNKEIKSFKRAFFTSTGQLTVHWPVLVKKARS